MKKWLIAVLATLLSLGVVMGGLTGADASTSSAPAERSDPDAVLDGQPPTDEQVVGETDEPMAEHRGIGYLVAHGGGVAALEGKGRVVGEGRGTLYVKDIAGDMRIAVHGFGRAVRLPNGWSKYQGAGNVRIAGSHVKVVFKGPRTNLAARGKGRFLLRGTGRFDVNGVKGSWPAHGAYST